MPLIQSATPEARSRNIAEMVKAGHPRAQAVAASYAIGRRAAAKKRHKKKSYFTKGFVAFLRTKSKDDSGHEHDSGTGQFTSGSGGSAAKKEGSPAKEEPKEATKESPAVSPGKLARAGLFLRGFGSALKNAPAHIRESALHTTVKARQHIDGALDKVLAKALPADVAKEVRDTVVETVLSTVQEELLGTASSDMKQLTPWTWKEDMVAKVGPFAVVTAAFSLCKRFKTSLCSKLAKALP